MNLHTSPFSCLQVTVHQGGQTTVVTMRRTCSNGARNKKEIKTKQRSPSEGSEAYGTGSTTSVVEQVTKILKIII